MLRFACRHCGTVLKARDEKAGASFPCPRCKQKVKVPLFGGDRKTSRLADDVASLDDSPPGRHEQPEDRDSIISTSSGNKVPAWVWLASAPAAVLLVVLTMLVGLILSHPRNPRQPDP